jgi:hypothetical protein
MGTIPLFSVGTRIAPCHFAEAAIFLTPSFSEKEKLAGSVGEEGGGGVDKRHLIRN